MAISEGALATCSNVPLISSEIDLDNITCIYKSEIKRMKDIGFYDIFGKTQNILGIPMFKLPMYYYFRITYYTTLVACGFGITKFLEVGPTRILPKDGLKNLGGYGLAIVIVLYSLQTKALGMGSDGIIIHSVLSAFDVDCISSTEGKLMFISACITDIFNWLE